MVQETPFTTRTEAEIQAGLAKLDRKEFLLRKSKELKTKIHRAIHENRLAKANLLREEKKQIDAQYVELCK